MRHLVGLLGAALALGLALVAPAAAQPAAGAAGPTVGVSIAEVDLEGPRISPVAVTVSNEGASGIQQLEVTLKAPLGWAVEDATTAVSGSVKPGQSVTVEFLVQVPEQREEFVLRTFTATASYKSGGTAHSVTGSRTQSTGAAYADLAEAYNNVGVTDESNPGPGNFDGGGNSFSAQALAAAGVVPGATISALGAELTWPDVPAGLPNNVAARGQTFALDGSGERLVFLGSAAGTGAGTVRITYADGTSTQQSLGFPNWCCTAPDQYGAISVIEMDHRNTQSGPANYGITYRVFANSVPLDPARTVAYVTLPANAAIHVFDMALAG